MSSGNSMVKKFWIGKIALALLFAVVPAAGQAQRLESGLRFSACGQYRMNDVSTTELYRQQARDIVRAEAEQARSILEPLI